MVAGVGIAKLKIFPDPDSKTVKQEWSRKKWLRSPCKPARC